MVMSLCISGRAAEPEKTQAVSSPALPKPPPVIPSQVINSDTNSLPHPAMREVGPGRFELGDIVLDQHQRTVTFPAVLNMADGALEYLLVTGYGKKHESLMRTDIAPYNIHLAMLLLGAGRRTNTVSSPPPPHIVNPSSAPISGDKVTIEVSWQRAGKTVRCAAEDMIYNREAKTTLPPGVWVYNGSAVWDSHFLAQRDGSIGSLVTDLSALMNNSGLGHDNDHIWTANPTNVPAVNTPLEVTLRLAGPATSK
jgi:hypothetical protein